MKPKQPLTSAKVIETDDNEEIDDEDPKITWNLLIQFAD